MGSTILFFRGLFHTDFFLGKTEKWTVMIFWAVAFKNTISWSINFDGWVRVSKTNKEKVIEWP